MAAIKICELYHYQVCKVAIIRVIYITPRSTGPTINLPGHLLFGNIYLCVTL